MMHNQQQLDLFFSQALDGFFFMMLDEPVRWDDSVDKEAVLDYVFDHQRITRANKAMLQQYGAAEAQYVGLTPRDLFAHDLAHGRAVWRQLFDDGRLHIETDERRMDGSPLWVEGDYMCLYDDEGRITGHFGIQRDVTGKKLAEQKLRESEARYRALFEQSNDANVLMWLDGRIVTANTRAAQLFGYELDEFTRLAASDVVVPEQHWQIPEVFNHLLAGKALPVYERTYIRKDGSSFIAEVSISVIYDSFGKPAHFQSIIRDISERKQIEQQLRESEDRYRHVVEVQTELICRYRPDFRLTFANEAFSRIYGKTPDQLIGQNLLGLLPEEERESISEQVEIMVSSARMSAVTYERMITTASGESRWYAWVDRLISGKSGEPLEIQTVGRDITELKMVQNALWDSEQRFLSILNSLHDLVWSVSMPGLTVIYMNSIAEKVYQRRVVEFMHESWLWLDMIHPDDHDIFVAMRDKIVNTGYAEAEYRIIRRDGSVCWLHDRGWVVKSASAKTRIDGIATDITERKLSERQELDLAVEKERVQMLASFVRDISHEFRTPLAIINSCLYLIEKVPDVEKRLAQTEQAKSQVSLIARLLDTLLTMSKLDSGVNFNFYDTDLNDLVRMLAMRWQPSLQDKQLTLTLELVPYSPRLKVDRGQITLALNNLFENAARHTAIGGRLTLRTTLQNDCVIIDVIDTGSGIDPDALPHIFKRFWRMDQAHTTPGFGLGLPIAQKIVERHNGTLDVESAPGQGSTFRITLPVEAHQ